MSQPIDAEGNPLTPLGWQGSGFDWEIYANEQPMRAVLYCQATQLAQVHARTKRGLRKAMNSAVAADPLLTDIKIGEL